MPSTVVTDSKLPMAIALPRSEKLLGREGFMSDIVKSLDRSPRKEKVFDFMVKLVSDKRFGVGSSVDNPVFEATGGG